jgi:patatin-like phospholipase/acyl hydrolase
MSEPSSTQFHILSLSGGGYFGLYSVSVLAGIEEMAGRPLARRFDLLAGTSVGGIIALGLAAEVPAIEIKSAFERNGTTIFSDRPAATTWWGTVRDLARYVHKPKYQPDALRRTIIELVGEETRIGDLKHPVIVPAVNLTKGRPQVFKTPHHIDFRVDLRLKVVDVALAASAAPTYFPVAEIDDALYADGGLYANSPDLIALHEAEHFFHQPVSAVHLLSIGTTTAQFSFAHAHGRQLGSFGWWREQRLVNVIIASQQHAVDYVMGHRLAGRYLRLDADQSREQERHLALDVATEDAQRTIRGLAAATLQAHINDPRLKPFLAHTARAPVFHRHVAT